MVNLPPRKTGRLKGERKCGEVVYNWSEVAELIIRLFLTKSSDQSVLFFYTIYVLYRNTNIKLTSVLESSVEFDSRLGAGVILVVMKEGDEQTIVCSNLVLKTKKGVCQLWDVVLNSRPFSGVN